jgi:hypothetical protein
VDVTWSAHFNPQSDNAIMADMSMPPLQRTGPPGIRASELTAWESRRTPVKPPLAIQDTPQRSEVARPNQPKPAPPKKEQSKQPAVKPKISQELTPRADEAHRFVHKMMKTELPMMIEQIVQLSDCDVTQAITCCIAPPRAVSGPKGDTCVNDAYPDTYNSEDCDMIRIYKTQIDEAS